MLIFNIYRNSSKEKSSLKHLKKWKFRLLEKFAMEENNSAHSVSSLMLEKVKTGIS